MTREEAISVLHKIKPTLRRADCKSLTHIVETIALDLAIEALEQETVSRESYDHEFFLRKELEVKIAKLEKTIEALENGSCEDCVSRSMAINKLKEHYWDKELQSAKDDPCIIDAMTDLDIRIIKDLPSVQSVQKWIPCSERLPEKSGRYLVTRGSNVCGSLWNKVGILNYSDLMGLKKEKIWWSGNVGKSDFETYDDVLAWMPLPKPYNAETKQRRNSLY